MTADIESLRADFESASATLPPSKRPDLARGDGGEYLKLWTRAEFRGWCRAHGYYCDGEATGPGDGESQGQGPPPGDWSTDISAGHPFSHPPAPPEPAERDLKQWRQHSVGLFPWSGVVLDAVAFNVARAAAGTDSVAADGALYRGIQSYLASVRLGRTAWPQEDGRC